jgi:hypothetical protein
MEAHELNRFENFIRNKIFNNDSPLSDKEKLKNIFNDCNNYELKFIDMVNEMIKDFRMKKIILYCKVCRNVLFFEGKCINRNIGSLCLDCYVLMKDEHDKNF